MHLKILAAALFILPATSVNAFSTNYNWSGFYAGVISGFGFGKFDSDIVGGGFPTTTDISGAFVGVTAGANYQFEQFVLGAESDIAWSGIGGNISCTATQTCASNLNWIGSFRARAGIALDNSLLFATAGVAIGNGTSTTSPATIGSTGTDTQTFVGWTVGLGAEYAVTEDIRLKAEYSYTDLGSRTAPAGTFGLSNAFVGKPTYQTIKVGVNFAFPTD